MCEKAEGTTKKLRKVVASPKSMRRKLKEKD